jgi:PAS domain S-box-containing protein
MTIQRKVTSTGTSGPAAKDPVEDHIPSSDTSPEDVAARNLLQFGPPSYVADLGGRIIYANPRYKALALEVFGPGHDPAHAIFDIGDALGRIIGGEDDVFEQVSATIDGVETEFRARHFPIRGDDGRLTGVGGIYREATLPWLDMQRIKERYDDICRLSCDMVWETDDALGITYFSPRVIDILGFHPREIIGRPLPTLGAFETGEVPAADRRTPFRDVAVSVTRRDGHMRQLRLSGVPMFSEEDGSFRGFRGTATDVSAENEARESAVVSRGRLTTAIENISEGLALYDERNQLVLCNSRFREYLAGAHGVLFPGAAFTGILRTLEENATIREPAQALESWRGLRRRAEAEGEAAIEIGLANSRWLRITDRPTEDGGIVSIVSDITESKDREETLRAAKELAEEGSRSKSEFLANMSHELRTPLNAIIGFSEIMQSQTLGPVGNPRYLEYLGDIMESSHHLLGVINDILDVAKAEAGRLELIEESVDVIGELRLTDRLFAEQVAEAGIGLLIDVPDVLPRLLADRRKIRQVVLNLVSNAIKFTPPGGEVTVSATLEREGGMTLVVADTGIGIAEDDIARALTPFGQVESSLARRYEGTGLGLPLTQALVERHGGTMVLESELGKGTRVYVRLPRQRVIT